MRYTKRGSVLVGCRRRGATLRIEVWDTGPGIPADNLDDIFKEFQRLESKDPDVEKGLGLGLAIVDRVAKMLGHPVAVRSWPGQGSCFSITVPVAETPHITTPEPAPRRNLGFGGALIVCIDNDATILEGMQALLGGWRCEVIGASCVADALSRIGDRTPDAVIVDYRLDDGLTGLVALDQLVAHFGHAIPSVVITADHTDPVRQAVERGGSYLLYKPVRPAALRALLGRLVQSARQHDGAAAMANRQANPPRR